MVSSLVSTSGTGAHPLARPEIFMEINRPEIYMRKTPGLA